MPIPRENKHEVMTTTEVAKYLRISTESVYRLVRRKEIPVTRIGRQLRFRRGTLEKWLVTAERNNYKS